MTLRVFFFLVECCWYVMKDRCCVYVQQVESKRTIPFQQKYVSGYSHANFSNFSNFFYPLCLFSCYFPSIVAIRKCVQTSLIQMRLTKLYYSKPQTRTAKSVFYAQFKLSDDFLSQKAWHGSPSSPVELKNAIKSACDSVVTSAQTRWIPARKHIQS